MKCHLLSHRSSILWGILALIATDLLGLIPPWLIKDAIDAIPSSETHWRLLPYTLLIIAIVSFQGLFRFIWRNHLYGLSRRVEYHLRNDLFRHLQTLSRDFFQRMKTGDLMSRATNDLVAIQELIGYAGLLIVDSALTIVTCLCLMAVIDGRLALLCTIPLPLLSVAFLKFGPLVRRKALEVQFKLAEISDHVQEAVSGIRVVQAFVLEEERGRAFSERNRAYLHANVHLARIRGIFYAILGLGVGLAAAIVLWIGGQFVLSDRITLGEFVAFNSYLSMLTWPMMALGFIYNLFQRGAASLDRLDGVFESKPSIPDLPANPRSLNAQGTERGIDFRDVVFSYSDDGSPILQGITFFVPQGARVAIMGPVGSGKSTLLKLLPRIYDVHGGGIRIDGQDIRHLPLGELRRRIAYVEQEPFLFSETIQENIAFGMAPSVVLDDPSLLARTAKEEAIRWAIQIAQLEKDLPALPHGMGTVVGERGVTLSGGQKQRIVLARAILGSPSILILDDAFSQLDTETEERILKALFHEMRETTILFSTHRAMTARRADEIVVLHEGRIAERGTHRALMEGRGFYRRVYERQRIALELDQEG